MSHLPGELTQYAVAYGIIPNGPLGSLIEIRNSPYRIPCTGTLLRL